MGFAWGELDAVKIFLKDSVIINGSTISIRANVEVDTVAAKQQPKWSDDADFALLFKTNAIVSPPIFENEGFYTVISNTYLPELGFEFNHTLGKSTQLNYRAGGSIGLASRFNSLKMNENAIGFHLDGRDLGQIVVVHDPLQNESDTLRVPISLMPHLKFNVGLEWHGVMRGARGWRVGAELEWTPIKDQLTKLNEVSSSNPSDWDDINYLDTFSIEESETNYLHVKAFAQWSPWNRLWFLRGSVLWSPKKIEGGITLGYHL